MLYRPSPSEVTVRTFSMRAGLVASAVTPGNTPPDASRITPAIPLACWAHAAGGRSSAHVRATRGRLLTRIRIIESSIEADAVAVQTKGSAWAVVRPALIDRANSSRARRGKCRDESVYA